LLSAFDNKMPLEIVIYDSKGEVKEKLSQNLG
jgi:hypothetical protein